MNYRFASIPGSVIVNLSLLSTSALFMWFFLQAETENLTVKNHNSKTIQELQVLMQSYEKLSKPKEQTKPQQDSQPVQPDRDVSEPKDRNVPISKLSEID